MSTDTIAKSTTKTATIYRMMMPGHTCPYGIKTLDLLERQGFDVEDVHLTTDAETTAFRERWNVETTPQTFVDGELVGTLDDVREFVGQRRKDEGGTSYWPVLTLFAMTFLMAVGAAYITEDQWVGVRTSSALRRSRRPCSSTSGNSSARASEEAAPSRSGSCRSPRTSPWSPWRSGWEPST